MRLTEDRLNEMCSYESFGLTDEEIKQILENQEKLDKIKEWFNTNQCNCAECEREKDMALLKEILEK